jgi:hypothetical protein
MSVVVLPAAVSLTESDKHAFAARSAGETVCPTSLAMRASTRSEPAMSLQRAMRGVNRGGPRGRLF